MSVQCRLLKSFFLLTLQTTVVSFGSHAIYAQDSPGSLDPTFSEDGKVGSACTLPISDTSVPGDPFFIGSLCSDSVNDMALQDDGSFVLAGSDRDRDVGGTFKFWRYLADGQREGTFGLTDLSAGFDSANTVAIQPDGNIVAAGFASETGAFVLVRYLPDGTLDPSFGSGGIVQTPMGFGDVSVAELVILPDGKLLVTGEAEWFSEGSRHLALARFLPDGQLDIEFGRNGRAYARFFGNANVSGLALLPDGRFVVSGHISDTNSSLQLGFAIMRFLPNGIVDSSFGVFGRVVLRSPKLLFATSLVAQDDGKVVVGGVGEPEPGVRSFAVIRLTETGALDPDFGEGGGVLTIFPEGESELNALVLQSDGKLVAGGVVTIIPGSRRDFGLVRYFDDGTLDPDFGTDGKVTTNFFAVSTARIRALVIQPDDKIVAAGIVSTSGLSGGGGTLPAMARYLP